MDPQTPAHAAVRARLAEIKAARTAGPRTIRDLAAAIGDTTGRPLDPAQLQRELTGRRPLRPERIAQLAGALGLEVGDLESRIARLSTTVTARNA